MNERVFPACLKVDIYMTRSLTLECLLQTGFVGALPHLLMTVIVPCGGMLADHIRKKGIMSTTNVRKVFNCGGFGMEAVFFIVVAYARTAFSATLALTFGVAFSGFAISGESAVRPWQVLTVKVTKAVANTSYKQFYAVINQ